MQKNFAEWRKRKRSDDMDLEDDRSVKEELLSGLQGQELASQGNQQLKNNHQKKEQWPIWWVLKALEKVKGVSLGKPWGP